MSILNEKISLWLKNVKIVLCKSIVFFVLRTLSHIGKMHITLSGDSKLYPRSECECAWLSHLSLCGPMMDTRPVQGVPRLSPNDSWDKLDEAVIGRKDGNHLLVYTLSEHYFHTKL